MIDFNRLGKYRENNRVEAKKALGGLPKSIWETYSAFANTLGGVILLGVEELADKSLHSVDLPDPDRLMREFWEIVNDPARTSMNILSAKDVYSTVVDGNHIVVINVPRADRTDRPIYVDGNPQAVYRRDGEGDYKCTKEEYLAMVRDAAVKTQDMRLLEELTPEVLDPGSLQDYRARMKSARPGHVWEQLEDEAFLIRIGAAGIGKDGRVHPTAAGLLLFGKPQDILREFRDFSLRYVDDDEAEGGEPEAAGENVYGFFCRVYEKLKQVVPLPAGQSGAAGAGEAPVHSAAREALVNALVNADYYGRGGVVIRRTKDRITFTNPGPMRIRIAAAVSGGVSDPRNSTLLKMFHLIDIGERTGSGIPNIIRVWEAAGWAPPGIAEETNPDRTVFTLPLTAAKPGQAEPAGNSRQEEALDAGAKGSILAYLTDNPDGTPEEIAAYIGADRARTRGYLEALLAEGLIVEDGAGNRAGAFKLKR